MDEEKVFVRIKTDQGNGSGDKSDTPGLSAYLLVLVKYRKFIVWNFLAVCIVVAGVSLLFSNWYTAKSTILPPQKESLSLGMGSSLLSGLSSLSGGMALPLMATPSDVYAAMAESRSVGEEVVKEEDLLNYYNLKTMEKAVKELASRTNVSVGQEGIVTIAYEDKSREKAASVANAIAAKLDLVNQETHTSRAKNSRIFIENRLMDVSADLAKAEEGLKTFQTKHHAIQIDAQAGLAIEAAANLQAELAMVDLNLGILENNLKDSPQIRQLKLRREELLRQKQEMETGGEGKAGVVDIPLTKVPDLGLQYARLYREVKIQSTLFELLTSEFEKAKLEESKDTPTIQILDRAVPPEKKSRPKRSFIVAFAGGFSLLFSIFVVFFKEYIDQTRDRNPQEYQGLMEVFSTLSSDWQKLKRRIGLGSKTGG